MKKEANNVLAQNKKASHDYFIKETIEAGIALTGTEIKSVRARRIQLRDGYVQIYNGNAYLENVHISEYKQGNIYNHDPLRRRQLLLHKKRDSQISRSSGATGDGYHSTESLPEERFCKNFAGDWARKEAIR